MRLLRLLSLTLLIIAATGCSMLQEYKQERALVYAPAPLNDAAGKAVIDAMYAAAMKAAQTDARAVPAWIDAGIARNAQSCNDWLSRISAGKRGLVLTDKNVNVLSGLATTLMGIAEVSSATVAAVGALQVAAAGISTNVQTDLLLAPSAYQVQTTLLGMLDSCSEQLYADGPDLSFGQAYTRLEACSHVCSFEAAQAAANSALAQTVTTVHPVSGAIKTMARPQ